MPEQAKIQTLHDLTTKEAVAPRTVLSAISGEGTAGQLVGFSDDNALGVVSPDEKPTEGSKRPLTSGTIFNEISKLATKEDLAHIDLPDNLVTSKDIELGEVELGLNADSLQGFNADYFASKDDLSTSKNTINEQLNSKAEKPVIITATIPIETWTGEDTKTITVEVKDIKKSDTPVVDVVLNGNSETKLALLSAWALILDITTNEGSITVEAADVPEIAIPISMMVVR